MSDRRNNNIFEKLGETGEQLSKDSLSQPIPPVLPPKELPLSKKKVVDLKPVAKIDTPAKLRKELERMRKKYAKL